MTSQISQEEYPALKALIDQFFLKSSKEFSFCQDSEKIVSFYHWVLQENKKQNLTRLTSPEDFFYGHCCDVFHFLKIPDLSYPALDLGSGVGVPGLLAALLKPNPWILVDSEKRKADYLRSSVSYLRLERDVSVFWGRVGREFFIQHPKLSIQTVVVRAVGRLTVLYPWIKMCSTWNKLVLFKGPSWEQEWQEFQATQYKTELSIEKTFSYAVGEKNIQRQIVVLSRVPRGTRKVF